MSENKKRINVYIPYKMYVKIDESDYSLTDAIISGLDLLFTYSKNHTIESNEFENREVLQMQLTELQLQNEALKSENQDLKRNGSDTKNVLQLLESNNKQMQEQLKVKDEQMNTKDTQIERLTDTMQAQAVQLQTLINQRALEQPKRTLWQSLKFW